MHISKLPHTLYQRRLLSPQFADDEHIRCILTIHAQLYRYEASWHAIRTTRQRRVRTNEICIPMPPFFGPSLCCFCFPISLSFSFLDVGLSCFNSALSVDNYSLSRLCFPSSVVEKKTTVYSHPSNLPPPRIGGANALPIVCGQYYPLPIYIQTKSLSISELSRARAVIFCPE